MATIFETITGRAEAILGAWEATAAKAASARGLSRPLLRNVIPKYLEALGEGEGGAVRAVGLLERHLSARIREGFAIEEIVDEIHLLGAAIVETATAAGPVAAEEVARLYGVLSAGAVAVTKGFHAHMLADEQADKRWLRELQAVATEMPLGEHAGPMRERLVAVVGVIREAMEADTVSLLLFDRERRSLVTAASTGRGADALEAHGERLGTERLSSLVSQSSDEPIAIDDVATSKLDVGDALRGMGLGALLAVRLPNRHRLVGALYLGFADAAALTPRRIRRAELLGDQLTLHLYNAQLSAELRATIAELDTDRTLRDRLVSVLAHDLRGPLAAVRARAQLLERSDAARDAATSIVRNVDRTDRMLHDLLDTFLIRAGRRIPLHVESCDLVAIAGEVIAELAAIHGPRFVRRGDETAVGFWSPGDLWRSIWNLASNAVKYGDRTAPISIGVAVSGEHVALSVHNVGPPIARERQARMFEPFVQLATQPGRHGWGLGLTLVKGTAAAHGGDVEVVSTAAEGTTFTMHLPRDARAFASRDSQSNLVQDPEERGSVV